MKRFQSDLKDAGVHQIKLIGDQSDGAGGQRNVVEPTQDIPWCSFYLLSKIFGLTCLVAALLGIVFYAASQKQDGHPLNKMALVQNSTMVVSSTTATFAKHDHVETSSISLMDSSSAEYEDQDDENTEIPDTTLRE